jgi:hypothetical protein
MNVYPAAMRRDADEHGTVTRFSRRITCEASTVSSASVILIFSGAVCLLVAGVVVREFMPRAGKTTPAWTQTDMGGTTIALGTFMLLIAGLALLAKGFIS